MTINNIWKLENWKIPGGYRAQDVEPSVGSEPGELQRLGKKRLRSLGCGDLQGTGVRSRPEEARNSSTRVTPNPEELPRKRRELEPKMEELESRLRSFAPEGPQR